MRINIKLKKKIICKNTLVNGQKENHCVENCKSSYFNNPNCENTCNYLFLDHFVVKNKKTLLTLLYNLRRRLQNESNGSYNKNFN